MVIDLNLLESPDPRFVSQSVTSRLEDAFRRLCQRDTRPMVEEEFMECKSAERAQKLALKPISLPLEFCQQDRYDLDMAVFELLGVADAEERKALCKELYHETAAHFRQIRIVELQKQEQRAGSDSRAFSTTELAADLWDGLHEDEKLSLGDWLKQSVHNGLAVTIPEGEPQLPDAADMLDATSVFFKTGDKSKRVFPKLELPSRPHAELVTSLSDHGIRGSVSLPARERDAAQLLDRLTARLAAIDTRSRQLAESRTSDDRRVDDLAGLLSSWMTHGKPHA